MAVQLFLVVSGIIFRTENMGLPRTPRFQNVRPINNPRNDHQNYSDPKHDLNPIEVPIDAIEVCVYPVKGRVYLTKTRVYRIYSGFSQFLSKNPTDIL